MEKAADRIALAIRCATALTSNFLEQEQELYVLTKSRDRVHKERAMRRRQLKWLWARLAQLSTMKLKREELLITSTRPTPIDRGIGGYHTYTRSIP